ncbi:hypothetical protein M427DRAFT_236953 [Gonapodya prolifera JEL478]|uniref:P-loop containing nucleoside triphosphate hydrolase protein n=1 Tax=Gonapodya prolifera (strain JEL478) TaxID=1344416 RepID=A0A139AMM3_GONPJ|nr:hypothetical protein M427DRAFT_236953 [Gonapodya prolifera JEL478]|eukprot:KXS17999.1 hypothetical protein M427DRAFT_236953 [Gonapodya prolifera JEL478]
MSSDAHSAARPVPGLDSVLAVDPPPIPHDLLLVILRGAPGSGKSSLARSIPHPHGIVLSTDDFFLVPRSAAVHLALAHPPTPANANASDSDPVYAFDPSLLQAAHAWNQERCRIAIQRGLSPIIVDNTNTQRWEARPYVEAAIAASPPYAVEFREPDTPWWIARDVEEMARRNTHGVPLEAVRGMIARWEPGPWTVQEVIVAQRPQFGGRPARGDDVGGRGRGDDAGGRRRRERGGQDGQDGHGQRGEHHTRDRAGPHDMRSRRWDDRGDDDSSSYKPDGRGPYYRRDDRGDYDSSSYNHAGREPHHQAPRSTGQRYDCSQPYGDRHTHAHVLSDRHEW